MHVFAASDKPSVIHSRNRKLIYSNVNVKVCKNAVAEKDCLLTTSTAGCPICDIVQ